MHRFLIQSRYITLIGVLFSLIISLTIFLNGAISTVKKTWLLISHGWHSHGYEVRMIRVMDDFLIGVLSCQAITFEAQQGKKGKIL